MWGVCRDGIAATGTRGDDVLIVCGVVVCGVVVCGVVVCGVVICGVVVRVIVCRCGFGEFGLGCHWCPSGCRGCVFRLGGG